MKQYLAAATGLQLWFASTLVCADAPMVITTFTHMEGSYS